MILLIKISTPRVIAAFTSLALIVASCGPEAWAAQVEGISEAPADVGVSAGIDGSAASLAPTSVSEDNPLELSATPVADALAPLERSPSASVFETINAAVVQEAAPGRIRQATRLRTTAAVPIFLRARTAVVKADHARSPTHDLHQLGRVIKAGEGRGVDLRGEMDEAFAGSRTPANDDNGSDGAAAILFSADSGRAPRRSPLSKAFVHVSNAAAVLPDALQFLPNADPRETASGANHYLFWGVAAGIALFHILPKIIAKLARRLDPGPPPSAANGRISLPAEALAALRVAAKNDYTVALLGNESVGKDRLVVLLGESHYKDGRNAEIGRDVLKHFPVRGIEGYDPSLTLGGRLFAWVARPLMRLAAFRSEGSTTQETVAQDDMVAVFHLEKNHKPGLAERVETLIVPTSILSLLLYVVPCMLPKSSFAHMIRIAALCGALSLVYFAVGTALSDRFQHRRWFRRLFGLTLGLVSGRDKTMAGNIDEIMREYPDVENILNIVGKYHVPGMKRLLLDAYGYKEIPLGDHQGDPAGPANK